MAESPLRRFNKPPEEKPRPKIWAEGTQRPPFKVGALFAASLFLSRGAVAPLLAQTARVTRRVAVNVKNGAGRIPADKLGRFARFVPSHLRVAGWIKTLAAVFSHASATADTDVKRGNALVAEVEPHLWAEGPAREGAPVEAKAPDAPLPEPLPLTEPLPEPLPNPLTQPVVLAEPPPSAADSALVEADPLAAIRGDLEGTGPAARKPRFAWPEPATGPALPPDPPGPMALMAIQVAGYGLGWATAALGLPYGLVRALWLYAKGTDLRNIGAEE
jgi:hypothetical protein